uniref:Uncharacterized protein n=1 Tax=Cyclophora tenuis TaxID=216820 RepID=A0A7S1DEK4_CYCTE|mmetsp:Transcript_9481/g.15846  ORF Transcript_9481/g.15846 Transcript_9481/m.15846 type:complete len:291 (+) Transcript_9481:110-982(+)
MNEDASPQHISREGYTRGSRQANTLRARACVDAEMRSRITWMLLGAIVATVVVVATSTFHHPRRKEEVQLPTQPQVTEDLEQNDTIDNVDFDLKVEFDLYVLGMIYAPEFCFQNRFNDYPGCSHPEEFWRTHMTIGGLFPYFEDGYYAEYCEGNETLEPSAIHTIKPQLERYWPNIGTRDHMSLWQTHWQQHGICSNLTQLKYFEAALNVMIVTPNLIRTRYGTSFERQELDRAFNNKALLVCSHRQWLKEVQFCMGRTPEGAPTDIIDCPDAIKENDNCVGMIQLATFP